MGLVAFLGIIFRWLWKYASKIEELEEKEKEWIEWIEYKWEQGERREAERWMEKFKREILEK